MRLYVRKSRNIYTGSHTRYLRISWLKISLFYREKVGIEETREILKNYLYRKDRNLNRLLKYAELMKCDKVLRHYLEMSI